MDSHLFYCRYLSVLDCSRKTTRGYAAARCADQSDCPVCGRTVAQNNRVLRLAFPPLFPLSLPLRPTFVTGHAVQGWTGRSSNTFAKKRQRVNVTFKKYTFLNFWWQVRTHDTSSRFHKSIQRHIKELKLPYNILKRQQMRTSIVHQLAHFPSPVLIFKKLSLPER